jgi:hypothetical protein
MKRLLKHQFIYTFFFYFGQSLKEGLFALIHFFITYTLDTDGKGGLSCCVVEASSWAEIRCLASLNN